MIALGRSTLLHTHRGHIDAWQRITEKLKAQDSRHIVKGVIVGLPIFDL